MSEKFTFQERSKNRYKLQTEKTFQGIQICYSKDNKEIHISQTLYLLIRPIAKTKSFSCSIQIKYSSTKDPKTTKIAIL